MPSKDGGSTTMHSKYKGGKTDGLDLKNFFSFSFRKFLENFQNPPTPLFGNASIFPFIKSFRVTPTLSVNSSLWSCSLRLGYGMELCLGPFQTVSYVLEYIQEYWGKVHKSIDLFYSPLIRNGIFTFSILKTLLFGTGKKVKSNESWGVVFLRMAKECSHRIGRRDTEQIRYLLWATIFSL